MADLANALAGFSAGIQGQLPQFMQQQQNARDQEQQMAAEKEKRAQDRMATYFKDANAALRLLEAGNIDGVQMLGLQRLQLLQQFPDADPSDSQMLVQLATAAKNGSKDALMHLRNELQNTVEVGKAYGIIEAPESKVIPASSVINGQVVMQSPTGEFTANPVTNLTMPAEVQEGYEIISPAEAATLGLPADKQFQRNTKTRQISQIGGGGTTVNVGQATEGERTAGILADRLDFAQSQINDVLSSAPEAEKPQFGATALNKLGLEYLANLANPAERQIIEASQLDMLDAALTLGTGAAYTREQLEGYRRAYFPQLGDDQRTIGAKTTRLKNLIDAAYKKAGRAAPEIKRSDQSGAVDTAIDDPLGILK